MQAVWEYVEPWLIYGALSFLSVFCPWALDRVRASHWFEEQRPLVKWLITIGGSQALRIFLPKILLARTVYQTDLKIAANEQVKDLMPKANELRKQYGDVPFHKGNDLKEEAVQGAMQKIANEASEIFKAIPARKVQSKIANAIDPAVKRERKRLNRTGGHSNAGYRQ